MSPRTPPPKARRSESRSAAGGGELLGERFDAAHALVRFAAFEEENRWGFFELRGRVLTREPRYRAK